MQERSTNAKRLLDFEYCFAGTSVTLCRCNGPDSGAGGTRPARRLAGTCGGSRELSRSACGVQGAPELDSQGSIASTLQAIESAGWCSGSRLSIWFAQSQDVGCLPCSSLK